MPELPEGTVTFVFTDIEGSTQLLNELGAGAYADELLAHRRSVRAAFRAWGGVEVEKAGDGFFFAFPFATDALAACEDALAALKGGPIRVRVGVHTGHPLLTAEGYVGIDIHRAARIAAAGHGGQVLVSQATRDLASGVAFRDLGDHRLKDLTRAERLYQLGEETFPALRSLNQMDLPVAASPLIGRWDELEDLVGLLRSGHRIVSVTGPGGVGKTRLALQAAADVRDDFVDGVFFVALAELRDPSLLRAAIAQAVGVSPPVDLSARRALLVLDNFEHLLPAAKDVAALLAAGAHLRVLITSRAPLRVAGEREYSLGSLVDSDAVAFFVERGRATGRDITADETVRAICHRLDNLPLALELAAARLRLLDPATLLARLTRRLPLLTLGARDAPERQQTLRATLEWSYDLLDAAAQQCLGRLSVFAGSFSLDAAEQVAKAGLEALEALVQLSLLKSIGVGRFLMLETVREFASEKLVDDTDARARHGRFYLEYAISAGPRVTGATGIDAAPFREVDLEIANIRAALTWADEAAEHELVMLAVSELWDYWTNRGVASEPLRALERAYTDDAPAELRLLCLRALEVMYRIEGELDAAEAATTRRHELATEVGDSFNIMAAVNGLGLNAAARGEPARAEPLFREACALADALGKSLHNNLADVLLTLGDLAGATAEAQLHLAFCERQGDAVGAAIARLHLADISLARKDAAAAAALLEQALPPLAARAGPLLGWALRVTAATATALGRPRDGAMLIGAAARLTEGTYGHEEHAEAEKVASALRAALGDRDFAELESNGREIAVEETVTFALTACRGHAWVVD